MASLIISYFASVEKEVAGIPLCSEALTTSAVSTAAQPVPAEAAVAKIYSDTAHYVSFGDGTPAASKDNGFYLAAGIPQWMKTYVVPGQSKAIAAVLA
jgi:hypothetical protein